VAVGGPNPNPDTGETSLLEAFWIYRRSSLAIALTAAIASGVLTAFVFDNVTASARFAVTDPHSTVNLRQGVSTDAGFASYTAQRAALANSAAVLVRASKIIDEEGGPKLKLAYLRDVVKTKSVRSLADL
jgi:hypothetical protein